MHTGSEFIYGTKVTQNLPVFGISKYGNGIISVFGDSNCLEDGSCMNLVDDLMEAIKNDGKMPDNFEKDIIQSNLPESIDKSLPIRITDSNFAKYSKVISSFSSSFDPIFRTLPFCHLWNSSPSHFSKNASFEL
uniref:Uncharacterized protein n=1 Tax=Panagrolaimus davidi TaxID=227884 RepID=A0A914PCH4_9BILA